jgi:peptidoglycan/xylan/chitin deacetylase (PgdA/CDA1 family)
MDFSLSRRQDALREIVALAGEHLRLLRLSNEAQYGGRPTLRVATFHSVGGSGWEKFRAFVSTLRTTVSIVSPTNVDALDRGERTPTRTEVALTFDDGFANNVRAARWLAQQGIGATFFVVPSLLGRSASEFLAYHAQHGVAAYVPVDSYEPTRGLTVAELREIRSLGHLIGLHPHAHRSLGKLDERQIAYEVDDGKSQLEQLLGERIRHFAYSFGHAADVPPGQHEHVGSRFEHQFMAVRGGNLPDRGPRCVLRDNVNLDHPPAFARFALLGGIDLRYWTERRRLAVLFGRRQPMGAGTADPPSPASGHPCAPCTVPSRAVP